CPTSPSGQPSHFAMLAPRGRGSRGRSAGCFPSLEVVAPLLSAAGLPARNIFCHEAAKHTKKKISWFSSSVLRVFVVAFGILRGLQWAVGDDRSGETKVRAEADSGHRP